MKGPLPIGDDCRGDLYTGLARGLGAGLSPERTLEAIDDVCDGALGQHLSRARNAVRKGTSLSLALMNQGLLPELDHSLVKVAEEAGRLEHVFDHLARRCERNHARWRKMKGRLLLPGFILVFAILVLPIPALFAGDISSTQYVLTTVQLLALIGICVFAAKRLASHWQSHGPPSTVTRVARMLPLTARVSRLHERAGVAESLALNMASGVAASDALGNMLHASENSVHRASLVRAKSSLDGGAALAESLLEAALLDAREGYAIVSAGEQAGRLESVLRRYADTCHGLLDDVYDLLAQWVPVLAYFAVAGVVAAGLLG